VILLLAVVFGVMAGWIRAAFYGRTFTIPWIDRSWLALLAVLPQIALFYLPSTWGTVRQSWAVVALSSSLVLLFFFVWCNRRYPAFWAMGAGLLMNGAAIALNGGLMPISPGTLQRIYPNVPADVWQVGQQVGSSKNVLLPVHDTRLEFLVDRFFLPTWVPYLVAFSLGDVLIAAGVIWFLWQAGGPRYSQK